MRFSTLSLLILVYFPNLSIGGILANTSLAEDCHSLSYVAEDYEYLVDFDGSMTATCKAAEKSAVWKACVICAGDDQRNQLCYFKQSRNSPSKEEDFCSAQAEAVSQFCRDGSSEPKRLVHCGKLTN